MVAPQSESPSDRAESGDCKRDSEGAERSGSPGLEPNKKMRAVSTLQPVDNGEPGLANEKRFRATALQRCIASVIIPSAALWSA